MNKKQLFVIAAVVCCILTIVFAILARLPDQVTDQEPEELEIVDIPEEPEKTQQDAGTGTDIEN